MTAMSVIVPTFGRPQQLAVCLDALARLQRPAGGWELIVVDDGTPGGVEHVVDQWSVDGVDARLVVQDNAGPATARNRGADAAHGQQLVFTDDDCAPRSDWLIRLQSCLAGSHDDLVGGATRSATRDIWTTASELIIDFIRDGERSDGPTVLPSNNLACSADRFVASGGFDTSFPTAAGEDREFSHRWAQEIGGLRRCPTAIVDHAHPPGLRSFWRQHAAYGRGAVRYRDRAPSAERRVGLGYVVAMIAHPLRTASLDEGRARRIRLSACIALSQLAVARGVLAELVATRRHRTTRTRPTGKHTA